MQLCVGGANGSQAAWKQVNNLPKECCESRCTPNMHTTIIIYVYMYIHVYDTCTCTQTHVPHTLASRNIAQTNFTLTRDALHLPDHMYMHACIHTVLNIPNDGPALTILKYIEENSIEDSHQPPAWKGYRALCEK